MAREVGRCREAGADQGRDPLAEDGAIQHPAMVQHAEDEAAAGRAGEPDRCRWCRSCRAPATHPRRAPAADSGTAPVAPHIAGSVPVRPGSLIGRQLRLADPLPRVRGARCARRLGAGGGDHLDAVPRGLRTREPVPAAHVCRHRPAGVVSGRVWRTWRCSPRPPFWLCRRSGGRGW